MAKMLATTAVAALVGAAVAIGVGLVGLGDFRLLGAGKRMAHATIYIDQVGGSCQIQTAPQTLEAFKRETVQWSIVNRCPDALGSDVQIEFGGNDPLQTSCVRRGRKKIQCTIRNAAEYATYKYTVSVTGAVTEDPDLEIVQ
jgi:hypothetical protein